MKKEKGKTKSEKVWASLLFTFSLLLFTSAANVALAETITVTQANFGSFRTLRSGNTYKFVENVDFTASATESAMRVADGASVVLEIPADVTVTLKGGAAAVIDGCGSQRCLLVQAQNVTLSGLKFLNGYAKSETVRTIFDLLLV